MLAKLTAALVAYGPPGILVLAFIDSAGIPVSAGMDALVILVAVESPGRAYLAASMGVLGSLIGNCVLFLAARKGLNRFAKAPQPGTKQRFRGWFERYGLLTIFVPALLPIPLPLKVFVISAAVLRTPFRSFLLVILAARSLRYFGEAYLGVKLGHESAHVLRAHTWEMIGGAVALFGALYLMLMLAERRKGRTIAPGS
jgi:membrane protein YqaA with SNARE-associated domain